MSEVTEYFLRHYTLVIDNSEMSHRAANRAGRRVLIDSGVTFKEYEAMSERERADRFASDIGSKVIELIDGWYHESVTDAQYIGSQLSGEVMILADSELEWALGDHYMPETSDAEEFLPADDAYQCGFCGGSAVYSTERSRWEHADAGDRVKVGGPGDFVSARHNEAGTQILTVDLVEADDE